MGLLSSLLGGTSRRRGYGGFGSARRGSSWGSGYGRSRTSSGFLGSNLGRMALGGLAAYGARRYMNSRRQQPPVGPSAY